MKFDEIKTIDLVNAIGEQADTIQQQARCIEALATLLRRYMSAEEIEEQMRGGE
jgi:elongation factor P--beta-lysine ligase